MRSRTLAFAVGVTLLSPRPSVAQDATAEYRKVAADFGAACSRGDAKATAAFYTADAINIDPGPNGPIRTVSRAAIEKKLTADLAAMKGVKCTVTVTSVRFPKPDIALGEGEYTFAVPGQPAINGVWMNVAVRQGGKWLITHDMGALKP